MAPSHPCVPSAAGYVCERCTADDMSQARGMNYPSCSTPTPAPRACYSGHVISITALYKLYLIGSFTRRLIFVIEMQHNIAAHDDLCKQFHTYGSIKCIGSGQL